jgi:hypothetical protein
MNDQQNCFLWLFPLLKNDAFYIIEDLQTSRYRDGWGINEQKDNTTLKMICDFINDTNNSDNILNNTSKTIKDILLYYNLRTGGISCAFIKQSSRYF